MVPRFFTSSTIFPKSCWIVESEAFDYLKAPIKRLAGKDVPIPYNPQLEKAVVPDTDEIVEEIKSLINR